MKNRSGIRARIVCEVFLLLVSLAFAAPARAARDPNNAALLYYEAIMACPKADGTMEDMLRDVLSGAEPNQTARKHVEGCEKSMRLVETAAKMPVCDWSCVPYSTKRAFSEFLIKQRDLVFAFGVDACIQALAGDDRSALARCLLMCRVRGHGCEGYPNFAALTWEDTAHRVIPYVLGLMPPDVQTLTWFQQELTSTPVTPLDFTGVLRADIDFVLQSIRNSDEDITRLRNDVSQFADDATKAMIEQMNDDQLVGFVRQSYVEFLNEARQVFTSDLPYRDAYEQLQGLVGKIHERAQNDPSVAILQFTRMDSMVGQYALRVHHRASANAIQVALQLYIAVAQTGRLPRRLPTDQPRDPFTGEDFDYEITKRGFVLRSQDRDIPGSQGLICEFAVTDPNALRQPESREAETPPAIPEESKPISSVSKRSSDSWTSSLISSQGVGFRKCSKKA